MSNLIIRVFDIEGNLVEEREMTDEEIAERNAEIAKLWATE
jgi:hypothetical protein